MIEMLDTLEVLLWGSEFFAFFYFGGKIAGSYYTEAIEDRHRAKNERIELIERLKKANRGGYRG